MSVYLSYLVPTTGVLAWYPLDGLTAAPIEITDQSGHGNHLSQSSMIPVPVIDLDGLNRRSTLLLEDGGGATPFFSSNGAISPLKTIVAILKVDGADFGAHDQGWATAIVGAVDALIGTAGGTKWGNAGIFSAYYKNGTPFVTSNMQAPFGQFAQIEAVYNDGSEFTDGLQLGQDRDNAAKQAAGQIADILFLSAALTTQQRAALKLYADLKFELWRVAGTTLMFPSPDITGIPYSSFDAAPQQWDDATDVRQYADLGESYNRATDTPPREWVLSFDCNGTFHADSKLKTDVFDAFWNAVGIDRPFSFTDKYGVTHTNVRIAKGGYSRAHDGHTSWIQKVSFRLRKTAG